MKKGCALSLLAWAVCVAIYASLAWPKIHEVAPTAIVGVLGGTFAAMLVGATVGLFTGGSDRAALQRARAGEPMKNGRLEAVSGPLRPLGAPLEAPFTGRPCVAYEYDVKARDGGKSDFAGMALTPSVVDGVRGPVRLLGWGMLDQFPAKQEVERARADAYLGSAPIEPLAITKALSVFSELAADDDGAIRKDFRIGDPDRTVEGKRVEEKVIPPGQVVTVLGVWDEMRGGFTSGGRIAMNRIYPIEIDAAAKKLGGDPKKTFFTALFFFAALHAILVPMWFLAKKDQEKKARAAARSATESIWDERDCGKLKTLLSQGADPNSRNQGRTALMNAAREGSVPCVEALIAAGARIEEKDDDSNTALDEAIMAGRDDTAAVLIKAGAKDFRVTEASGGRPVALDSEPVAVVKEYLGALGKGDIDGMSHVFPGKFTYLREHRDELLPVWRQIRPMEPESVSGFATDEAATFRLTGTNGRVAAYHVQKTLEGWRIFREWLPEE